jgi:hypothetical protein
MNFERVAVDDAGAANDIGGERQASHCEKQQGGRAAMSKRVRNKSK